MNALVDETMEEETTLEWDEKYEHNLTLLMEDIGKGIELPTFPSQMEERRNAFPKRSFSDILYDR